MEITKKLLEEVVSDAIEQGHRLAGPPPTNGDEGELRDWRKTVFQISAAKANERIRAI